jgi:hypothetical protein
MNNSNNSNADISSGSKVLESDKDYAIIHAAVDVVLENMNAIDNAKATAAEAEGSQLQMLMAALKDYPRPMSEEVWEKVYRPRVAARLDEAKVKGSPRYKTAASRDVTVNMLKAATIGLTLAKSDPTFSPAPTAKNLRKYADEVRPKLQASIDPDTGKPRIRSGSGGRGARPVKAAKPLAEGAYYWLVGCKDGEKGIGGPNTILAGGRDLEVLKSLARRTSTQFAAFKYLASKEEALEVAPEKVRALDLPIMNSSVFADSISA